MATGSDVMHVQPKFFIRSLFPYWFLGWGMDWTDGCIAVGNQEIEELLHAIKDGTPIEIMP